MYSILIVITTIIAILLMIIVLLQSSKGGGLAGTFGGVGGMGTMFGTRRTADFLSKASWWLAASLAVLTIIINLFFLPGQSSTEQRESIIQRSGQQNIPQTPSLPPQQTPNVPSGGNQPQQK
jgi:preprotein translocase subunit SecG